jgi:hypothetical protein
MAYPIRNTALAATTAAKSRRHSRPGEKIILSMSVWTCVESGNQATHRDPIRFQSRAFVSREIYKRERFATVDWQPDRPFRAKFSAGNSSDCGKRRRLDVRQHLQFKVVPIARGERVPPFSRCQSTAVRQDLRSGYALTERLAVVVQAVVEAADADGEVVVGHGVFLYFRRERGGGGTVALDALCYRAGRQVEQQHDAGDPHPRHFSRPSNKAPSLVPMILAEAAP